MRFSADLLRVEVWARRYKISASANVKRGTRENKQRRRSKPRAKTSRFLLCVIRVYLWQNRFTMSENTLTVTDNRTGKQYQLPIQDGTIRAMDLRQIKMSDDDFGLMTYDPAFMNTASCKSRITFIDRKSTRLNSSH